MNFIFFGFKSCGKTRIAHYLAKKLSRTHIDTDHLIEELYAIEEGMRLDCHGIALKIGEENFRALEKRVILSLSHLSCIQRQEAILSVGGGAVLDAENREQLSALGQLIYIQISKDELKKRLLDEQELPFFLDPRDPDGSFEKMYAERMFVYESIPAQRL